MEFYCECIECDCDNLAEVENESDTAICEDCDTGWHMNDGDEDE